jgi:hypothetical protein
VYQQNQKPEREHTASSERLADRLDKLSVPLAENVIRRAIELHHDQTFETGERTIDRELIEQVGAELGIGPDIIRRALIDELRTERDERRSTLGERVLGVGRVSGGVVVKGTADDVEDATARWMAHHEGLRPRAKSARSVRWERDSGIGTAIRRGMKQSKGTGDLRRSPSVITRQTQIDPDEHLVEIDVDTSNIRTEAVGIGFALAAAAGALAAAVGLASEQVAAALAVLLPGLGAALGGVALYARSRIARIRRGLNRALDGILHPIDTLRHRDGHPRSDDDDGGRRSRKRRKPTWADVIEDIVDEIFD